MGAFIGEGHFIEGCLLNYLSCASKMQTHSPQTGELQIFWIQNLPKRRKVFVSLELIQKEKKIIVCFRCINKFKVTYFFILIFSLTPALSSFCAKEAIDVSLTNTLPMRGRLLEKGC